MKAEEIAFAPWGITAFLYFVGWLFYLSTGGTIDREPGWGLNILFTTLGVFIVPIVWFIVVTFDPQE